MQPRLHGAERDAQGGRDLGQRQPQEVVQDDDRARRSGRAAAAPRRRGRGRRGRRTSRRRGASIGVISTSIGRVADGAAMVEAGVDGQAVEPGVEPVGIAQRSAGPARPGSAPPGPRRARAPGPGGSGGRPRPAARGRAGELGEGVMIALASPARRVPLVHGQPLFRHGHGGRARMVWRRRRANSFPGVTRRDGGRRAGERPGSPAEGGRARPSPGVRIGSSGWRELVEEVAPSPDSDSHDLEFATPRRRRGTRSIERRARAAPRRSRMSCRRSGRAIRIRRGLGSAGRPSRSFRSTVHRRLTGTVSRPRRWPSMVMSSVRTGRRRGIVVMYATGLRPVRDRQSRRRRPMSHGVVDAHRGPSRPRQAGRRSAGGIDRTSAHRRCRRTTAAGRSISNGGSKPAATPAARR